MVTIRPAPCGQHAGGAGDLVACQDAGRAAVPLGQVGGVKAWTYSHRSATEGSTRAARIAGGTDASAEAAIRHSSGKAMPQKSEGLISNSSVVRNCPKPSPS